ncbi:testis-expressed protein 26-like [Antedon mediterranea]|uniref:testis-expressed protein 26-like n=1 Tax=Antedon mediterranea TaxID=105859 RepID=UPI003AF87782
MAASGMDTQYRGPISAFNTQSVDSRTKFLTEIGDGYVTQGFARNLETFYNKANEQDRKRCIHLLASLALGESVNAVTKKEPQKIRRPKTAGPSFGGRRPNSNDSNSNTRSSYQERPKSAVPKKTLTTYRTKYPAKQLASTKPIVPPSTDDMFRPTLDSRAKVGDSTYSSEFYNKGYNRTDLIPSGSASGNRRNNPHPFKSFIVWKFPKGAKTEPKSYSRELTDRMMDEVLADKCSSTYQNDYLGIPQGFQMKSAFDEELPEDKPQFTLDSTMRFSYQYPKKKDELQTNISNKYGCYRHLHRPATGIVPTAANEQNMRTFTSYDQFFNRPYKPGQAEISEAVKTGKIAEYMRIANDKERDVLTKMLGDHIRRPPTPKYHPRPPSSQTSSQQAHNLTFISGWTGPM